MVNEAVDWAGGYAGKRVARFLAALNEPTPSGLFAAMVRQWTDEFQEAGFASGCPVAATVDCAESTVHQDRCRRRVRPLEPSGGRGPDGHGRTGRTGRTAGHGDDQRPGGGATSSPGPNGTYGR